MRSLIHDSFGEPAELLHLADLPTPEPGPGKVRIRTTLSPIHNHDLWTIRGSYGYKPPLPAIGGSEAVGVVEAVGEGVDAALLGQRIAVAGVHGSWAEYFLASPGGLVPVPDAVSDEAAAQLIAMPFSAISLLEVLSVAEGDWIIQNAANGAVGKTLAMLAKGRGVNTINLVRRDAGVAELGLWASIMWSPRRRRTGKTRSAPFMERRRSRRRWTPSAEHRAEIWRTCSAKTDCWCRSAP